MNARKKAGAFDAGRYIDTLFECGAHIRIACRDGEPIGISEGLCVKQGKRKRYDAAKASYHAAGGRSLDKEIVAECIRRGLWYETTSRLFCGEAAS
jgi:hypothetical protein